jgi:hypothetical protein
MRAFAQFLAIYFLLALLLTQTAAAQETPTAESPRNHAWLSSPSRSCLGSTRTTSRLRLTDSASGTQPNTPGPWDCSTQ